MAGTLLQWAIDNRDKMSAKQGALVMMLDQVSPIFRYLPMEKIEGAFYEFDRVATLGSVAWRAINAGYVESTGSTTPYREYLKILGGEAKEDVHLLRTSRNNGSDTLRQQTRMKLQAAANEWERSFLEGSELSNPAEMIGLRARISGDQLVLQTSGGGALTLAKLDSLIDAVPFEPTGSVSTGAIKRGEGITKLLLMSRTVYAKMNALIFAATGSRRIDREADAFGRYVEKYRGCTIVVVEQSGTGTTTLDYDEDPGDATADTASVYCVALGEGLLHGIYNNGVDRQEGIPILMQVQQWGSVEEIGTVEEPRVKLRFEGSYGISADHPRCIARLYGITNA